MNDKRGRWHIQVELSPCHKCGHRYEIYDNAANAFEMHDLMDECKSRCPSYADFKRYGINRLIDPSIEEVDLLIEGIGKILEEKGAAGFSENDLERLEVLGHRLSVVLNLEEARLEAAKNMLLAAHQAIKGKEEGP